ncbi:factor-independent urate hydroxylase [Intrasporangium flavum]|uniref:factor-independent urate hydroxylase n=1 Tax=Intrasporangium flavum TaxID=1428657 RepID=UPI00096F36A1|nr:urate oxidase [Intrasporangium flavum]
MSIVLGPNQYGKAENRVVRITRDTARHEITDLNVSTSLRGDFDDAHVTGDQSKILPTDTQKNTAFAWAKKHGVASPEGYALALAQRFLDAAPAATAARIEVEQYAWDRIPVGGAGHDHAFVRRGGDVRTAVVTLERGAEGQEATPHVISGLKDLVVLKSTGSEFKGYLKDEYTTLAEADDRILATSLVARWRHTSTDVDWNKTYDSVRDTLLELFATTYSRALQETLHAMGQAVLERHPDIAEIRFSAPNKHHFLVDFSRFPDVENHGEVFIAADRPYGLIEASVLRDDVAAAPEAWLATPGFC